jgi:hypothetical protein
VAAAEKIVRMWGRFVPKRAAIVIVLVIIVVYIIALVKLRAATSRAA